MAWRNRVEVSYGALRDNVACIRRLAAPRAVIAVVKADAYGLGLERCARIYLDAGAAAVAVASLGEADRLRRAAPQARIILLGSPLPEERPAVINSGYEVVCSNADELAEFAHLADPQRPHPVHLAVDTGMGRAGCRPEQASALLDMIAAAPALRLAGISTHYPCATDPDFSASQEDCLAGILDGRRLPEGCWIHVAASEGLLLRPTGPATAVRIGLLLSGVVPPGCPDPGLRPAIRWVSSVALVKTLPAGHSVSYGRLCRLERPTHVALVPVGYADGYPIAASSRGRVLIAGRSCPILGRVTMDYLMVDVTDLARVPVPGDPVVLVGSDGEACLSVVDLAELAGTIPYDILCGLRGRCEIVGVP